MRKWRPAVSKEVVFQSAPATDGHRRGSGQRCRKPDSLAAIVFERSEKRRVGPNPIEPPTIPRPPAIRVPTGAGFDCASLSPIRTLPALLCSCPSWGGIQDYLFRPPMRGSISLMSCRAPLRLVGNGRRGMRGSTAENGWKPCRSCVCWNRQNRAGTRGASPVQAL